MSMQKIALPTSTVSADSPEGEKFINLCRVQYDKAGLDKDAAQRLDEHPDFASYIAKGIGKFSKQGPIFPAYLEIEVGGKSKEQFLSEMKSARHIVADGAWEMMCTKEWQPGKRRVVKFVHVYVKELGFSEFFIPVEDVWNRIRSLGYELCESADAPAICLTNPRGLTECCTLFAMKQIEMTINSEYSNKGPGIFGVSKKDKEIQLRGILFYGPKDKMRLDDDIIFRFRR